MKSHRKGLARVAALSALLLCASAHAEWVQSADPLIVNPSPAMNQVQAQNPPGFSWARHPSGAARYELEIASVALGTATRVVVDRNWYLPSQAMALGKYTWRVRPTTSQDWSDKRTFTVAKGSIAFEVPENDTLRARILSKPRPRSLPSTFTPMASWSAPRLAEMESYVSRLGNEVKAQATVLPNLTDARWPLVITSPLTAAMASQQTDVRQRINEASRQLEAAAVMWRLTADRQYLTEALKRGDQLAGLNTVGPTSYANQDQATRQIALSLIKAVDILGSNLDIGRKPYWLQSVKGRTNQIYASLAGDNGRLDQFPFDSHGNTSLVFLVLISSLSLGDIDDAAKWFNFSFRAYANSPSPWSGPEGGYANGTAYAEYTAGYLVALWDPLNNVTGVNFYAKPWTLGFLDFVSQFTPPGSRFHAFGDGSDSKPDYRVFRAFASRMWSPRAAWFVKKLGGLEDSLSLLQARYPLPVADTKVYEPPANAAYYPSIGWTAMHSDLTSSTRTSVFFKSSPYGSFNHSHGDQNGLLLSVAGQPLLLKAGYYDWYGSPLWNDWYRQTRSQNAVTFDGGKGQVVGGYREQLLHNGKITAFSSQPDYSHAEGDATPAYGGQLTLARRQVWYLRGQDAVLVRDRMAAKVPHTYEFNLHAPATITAESSDSARIVAGGQSLCVRSLNGDAPFARWTGPAPKAGVTEDHAAFYLKNDGKSTAEFLVLLDVGCKRPVVSITSVDGLRTVKVGSQTVTIN
jgi:hypothetical protein